MTNQFHVFGMPLFSAMLFKRMVAGAVIGLVLISLFIYSASGHEDPAWGKYWMVKPLIIVPVAAAMGGAFYHYMGQLRILGGWIQFVAVLVSIIGFIVALWLGTVLGLNGTYWD